MRRPIIVVFLSLFFSLYLTACQALAAERGALFRVTDKDHTLYLYGTIQANAPLPQLSSVRELRITGCKLADFNQVVTMTPQVTVLRISEYPTGLNVAGIENLRHLKHLDIRHCSVTGRGIEEALRRIPRVDRFTGWK